MSIIKGGGSPSQELNAISKKYGGEEYFRLHDAADKFTFPQRDKDVYESFNLPVTYEYRDEYFSKTIMLKWASNNPKAISIDENGYATVNPLEFRTPINLECTFVYEGSYVIRSYDIYVYKQLTLEEQLLDIYNSVGLCVTIRGWVVAKEAFNSGYSETSLYVVHESKIGGIYAYKVKCDQATYDKISIGTGVKLEGLVYDYRGLIELNAGCTVLIDETLDPVLDVETLYQAIDKNILVGAYDGLSSITLRQSSLVSLTGWRIDKIGTATLESTKSSQTVLTLKKNDTLVNVMIKRALTPYDSATASTIIEYQSSLQVGDYVDVKGILGYANQYQIICIDSYAITKVKAEVDVDVSSVIDAIKTINSTIPTTVSTETTVELPQSTSTVEYSYSTVGDNVKLNDDNTITIEPNYNFEPGIVIVLIKACDLEYRVVIFVNTVDYAIKVEYELYNINFETAIDRVTNISLNPNGLVYNDVKFSYEIKADCKVAKITDDGYLFIVPIEENDSFILTVTAVNGDVNRTRDVQFDVKGYKYLVRTVDEISSLDDGQWVFVSGVVSRYYEDTGINIGVYIKDDSTGKELQVYGLHDYKGEYAPDEYPKVGSNVVLYGAIETYNAEKRLMDPYIVYLNEETVETSDLEKIQFELDSLEIKDRVIGTYSKKLSATGKTYLDVCLDYSLSDTSVARITDDGYLYIVSGEKVGIVTLIVKAFIG